MFMCNSAGEEPAHDFLSLRAGGGSSPFQHRLQSAQQGENHRCISVELGWLAGRCSVSFHFVLLLLPVRFEKQVQTSVCETARQPLALADHVRQLLANMHFLTAGYGLGPHSLVKPAEPVKQSSSHGGDGAVSAAADLGEQVLPGGVGTFSIRQVPDARPREEAGMGRDASVAAVHQGSRMEIAHEARSGAMVRSAPPSTMWQDSGIDKRSRGKTTG